MPSAFELAMEADSGARPKPSAPLDAPLPVALAPPAEPQSPKVENAPPVSADVTSPPVTAPLTPEPVAAAGVPEPVAVVQPAAVVAPTVAQTPDQVVELTRQLNESRTQLAALQAASTKQQANAALEALRAQAAAIDTEFGGEIGKAFKALTDLTINQSTTLAEVQAAAAQREENIVHEQARQAAPVMKAIYTNISSTDPEIRDVARAHFAAAKTISDRLANDPQYAEIPLPEFYKAVEARVEKLFPGVKAQYYPGPVGVAPAVEPTAATVKTAAAAPKAPTPARVEGPITLSDIPGGASPAQNKPFEISALSPLEQMRYVSGATGVDIQKLRNSRR